MALTMPFVLGFALGPYGWRLRAAAAASAFFIMFVAVIGGARVGTVGCLVAVTLFALAWAVLKWRREPTSLVGPAVALAYPALLVALIAGIAFIGRLRTMVWGDGSEAYSTNARVAQLKLGIPKILSHPEGYGIAMAGQTLDYHPFGFLSIDNYYLAIALDYGVLGFLLYYGIFVAAIAYCARARGRTQSDDKELWTFTSLGISLTTFVIIKSSFSEQSNHPIVFMMLGMVAALTYRAFVGEPVALGRPPSINANLSAQPPARQRLPAPPPVRSWSQG